MGQRASYEVEGAWLKLAVFMIKQKLSKESTIFFKGKGAWIVSQTLSIRC